MSAPVRILVIRLSAMGDVAMTVPVVAALRRARPDAQIVMLTPAFLQPFFREVEGIEFFAPELRGRHKGLIGLWRLRRDLGHFDAVADLHDVLRSQVLRRLLRWRGARVAHIDKGRREKRALVSLEHKVRLPLKTTIERYRDVFVQLGINLPPVEAPVRVRYPLSPALEILCGAHTGRRIGIAPFAKHRGKIYPPELMEQVVASLVAYSGARLFIFGGGASEQAYAEELERRYTNVRSVIGRVGLAQEMELISNLDVLVSMDSSAMHMASLVGVPVVSVWGATHPDAGFYGLGQAPTNAVQLDMWCRPCSIYGKKPCAFGGYPCLVNLPPAMIAARVRALLEQ